jgi:hypothetical protein
MSRFLWVAYFVVVGAFATLPTALALRTHIAPAVEAWASPIFKVGEIPAETITRVDGYLCWTWVTDKLKVSAADDIDAVLSRPAIGDVSWPEVVDAHTRHPWHRLGSRPPKTGLHYDSCVRLPDDLRPDEPVTLTQTLYYESAWGPWRVAVHPPDVVAPGRPRP